MRREGYAVARDGSPIYYELLGNPDAKLVLVLLDGIGCDGYIWKYFLDDFRDKARLVHIHYRGHGRTPVPKDRHRVSIPDLADDLEAVFDTLGVTGGVLVGHSLGVQVCLETYRRHRRFVQGLVLMCGSYGNPLRTFKGTDVLEHLLPWLRMVVKRAPKALHSAWRTLVPTRLAFALAQKYELNPELVKLEDFMPYLEHMSKVDLTLFVEMLGYAGRHTAKEILSNIDVPALIIAGDNDSFTPVWLSQQMNQEIPNSRLLVVEAGTHTAPIERPQLVNSAVEAFLSSFDRLRSAA